MAAEAPGPAPVDTSDRSKDQGPISQTVKDSRETIVAFDRQFKMEAGHEASEPLDLHAMAEEISAEGEAKAESEAVDGNQTEAASAPEHKLYDQDEDPDATPGAVPMARVAIRAQRAAERAAEEATRKQEADAARTRINDVDLAHGMAIIADKGYDKARAKTEKADQKASEVTSTAEKTAKTAERSARTHRSRHHNEEAATAREQEAATARAESAAEATKIKQEAQERGEAALAKAWAKAETYKEAEVEKLSTQRTDDDQVAWDAALAEKGPREQAMTFEKRIDENNELPKQERMPEAERLRQEDLAADLRDAGTKAADAAQAASETKRDADNKAINDQLVKASGFINGFVTATEPAVLTPIGVNKDITPEMVERLATDLQHSFKVDFAKEPLDSKPAGARIFGQKFTDIYRQSEEPSLRGVVFIERFDKQSGKMVRLDIVSAPRPEKPALKPGKFKLGFVAERLYNRKERQWRAAVEDQLAHGRHFGGHPDAKNPFIPGDPAYAARSVDSGGSVGDSSYSSILQRRGMSAESAQHVRKPRRLWFGLFG